MKHLIAIATFLFFVTGCVSTEQTYSKNLTDVPASVLTAARTTVQGGALQCVGIETVNGVKVYTFTGANGGVHYKFDISEQGDVLNVAKTDRGVDVSEASFSE